MNPSGITSAIRNFLRGPVAAVPVAPPNVNTGAGLPAVWEPPTVQAPPNAVDLVDQQLDTSFQLSQNTATGSGIGAGGASYPVTMRLPGRKNTWVLVGLGVALVLAYAWDKGKL